VKAALASAAALINISGVNWIEEFARIPIRVLVDTDPGRTQFRGEGRPRDHNLHFTFGLNIGAPDCGVPSPGVNWRPTLQPIALDLWRPGSGAGASFRTIMNWRSEPNIAWGGEVYGEKAESIASFIDLPSRTTAALELAVGAGATAEERRDFTRAGWTLVEANPISRGLGRYQRYLRGARGEWSVSKEIHTRARTGWFGDRSPCFLALGKPCVLQDTGFSRHLPVGEGLLAFRDLEEAVDALDRVEADYDRHARAARRLAEEHFDSDRVLGAILGAAGIGVRAR
jgi:hypothetical protein